MKSFPTYKLSILLLFVGVSVIGLGFISMSVLPLFILLLFISVNDYVEPSWYINTHVCVYVHTYFSA